MTVMTMIFLYIIILILLLLLIMCFYKWRALAQNVLSSWITFLWNGSVCYDFGITLSNNLNFSYYLDAVTFTFQYAFLSNILGQKCLGMHPHKKAEDSCVLELIKILQFESVAFEMMKREQGLNTPATSIQIPWALQNKAEVLAFVRLDTERQRGRDARSVSAICIQSDGFDLLLSLALLCASNRSWKEGKPQVKLPSKQITLLE